MSHPDREREGGVVVLLLLAGLVVLLGGAYAAAYLVAGDNVPRGTTVGGVPVGGHTPDVAQQLLASELGPRTGASLTLVVQRDAERESLETLLAAEAAVGGATVANAATSSSSSSSSGSTPAQPAPSGQPGPHTVNGKSEQALSGDVAAAVQKAALAKVSGTVERVETNVDSSAPYEAHIRKADGTEVEVQVNKDYTVAAVNTMGAHP